MLPLVVHRSLLAAVSGLVPLVAGCANSENNASTWINDTYSRSEIEWACDNTQPNTAGLDWYPEIGFSLEELTSAWSEECRQFGKAAEEPAAEEPAAEEPAAEGTIGGAQTVRLIGPEGEDGLFTWVVDEVAIVSDPNREVPIECPTPLLPEAGSRFVFFRFELEDSGRSNYYAWYYELGLMGEKGYVPYMGYSSMSSDFTDGFGEGVTSDLRSSCIPSQFHDRYDGLYYECCGNPMRGWGVGLGETGVMYRVDPDATRIGLVIARVFALVPRDDGIDVWDYPYLGEEIATIPMFWLESGESVGRDRVDLSSILLTDPRTAWANDPPTAEEPAPEDQWADDPPTAEGPAPEEQWADEQVSSCGGEYRYDNELPISVCSESASVALFQEALGVEPDGYFGPGTQTALIMLQDRAGLPITRRIDAATWAHLGVTANAPYDDLNGDGVIDASEFPG